MLREGHYGVTLVLAAGVIAVTGIDTGFALTGVMLGVTMLPDIDHHLPWIGHRGVTHTIVFAVGVSAASGGGIFVALNWARSVFPGLLTMTWVKTVWWSSVIGGCVCVTVTAHIFTDALTVGSGYYGVQPFEPVTSREVRAGLWTADNKWANMGLLFVGAVVFFVSVLVSASWV